MGTEPGPWVVHQRGGPAAEWTLDNPVLEERQLGWETDTLRVKLGDGVTAWNDLPFAADEAASVAAEVVRAMAAEADLQDQIDTIEASDVESVAGVAPVGGDVVAASLKTALNLPADTNAELANRATDAELAAEATTRGNADTALDGRLDTVEADLAGRLSESELDATYADRVHSTALPVYVYGNSLTVLPPPVSSSTSYLDIVEDELEAPALTTYGQGGRRIVEMAWGAINEFNAPGMTAPVAGAEWPGEARKGIVLVDTGTNDNAHGATAGNVPVAIAGTAYREGIKACYRTLIALASSSSRIEQESFVAPTDAWITLNAGYYSNGSIYYTTTVGRRLTYSVTPPQRGPLAGKVFLLTYTVGPTLGVNSIINVSVDGGANTPFSRFTWEEYVGNSGSNITHIPTVITVTVPVDGAAHTVMLTHAGSAGQFAHTDCCIVPSETPSPVMVLQSPLPVTKAAGWTAPQVAAWKANAAALDSDVRSVVAEFPNAYWVPTNLTPNGMWSTDGIHPNDRGMAQRGNDVLEAVKPLKPYLDALALQALPDGDFPVI